jgi:outer membrane protein TolC
MISHISSILTRAFLFTACALGCGGFVPGESPGNALMAQEAPQEVSDVMQVYQEIIAIRQAMLEDIEQSHRSGRANVTELSQAKIDLAEARLHLAEAQEKCDEAARELRTILLVRQETLDTLKHRQDSGRVTQHELYEAHIAVLEAEIRLTRDSQLTA